MASKHEHGPGRHPVDWLIGDGNTELFPTHREILSPFASENARRETIRDVPEDYQPRHCLGWIRMRSTWRVEWSPRFQFWLRTGSIPLNLWENGSRKIQPRRPHTPVSDLYRRRYTELGVVIA